MRTETQFKRIIDIYGTSFSTCAAVVFACLSLNDRSNNINKRWSQQFIRFCNRVGHTTIVHYSYRIGTRARVISIGTSQPNRRATTGEIVDNRLCVFIRSEYMSKGFRSTRKFYSKFSKSIIRIAFNLRNDDSKMKNVYYIFVFIV